jgi:hypothetical protein
MTPTARAQLAELSRRLAIEDWRERRDSDGIVAIAGPRAVIKPGVLLNGTHPSLQVVQRPAACAAVQGQKQRLIEAGLLDHDLTLRRMPTEAEVTQLRELIGLRGGGGAA